MSLKRRLMKRLARANDRGGVDVLSPLALPAPFHPSTANPAPGRSRLPPGPRICFGRSHQPTFPECLPVKPLAKRRARPCGQWREVKCLPSPHTAVVRSQSLYHRALMDDEVNGGVFMCTHQCVVLLQLVSVGFSTVGPIVAPPAGKKSACLWGW